MKNREAIRKANDEELHELLCEFAYRSNNYIIHYLQLEEWLDQECSIIIESVQDKNK